MLNKMEFNDLDLNENDWELLDNLITKSKINEEKEVKENNKKDYINYNIVLKNRK